MKQYNCLYGLKIVGDDSTIFFTKGKLKVSKGYLRIFKEKKTTIEFLEKNIYLENLFIPHHLKWRLSDKSDLIEYRSKDYCRTRIFYCKLRKIFFCNLRVLKILIENKGIFSK